MKKILLVGLFLFSALASAHGYGPPQHWNAPAYPEGRHHPPPPPHYRYREEYRYERHEFRAPPAWSCTWHGGYGWGCRIWYADPYYRRW